MKRFLTCALTLMLATLLTVPAFANFTPSVEAKPAPDVVPEGEIAAVIKDSAGNVVDTVTRLELIITPASKKHEAVAQKITDNLVRAETRITQIDHLGHLTPELEQVLLRAQKENKIPHISEVKIEDLVVRDLFDVSVVRDGQVIAIPNGHTITFSIQTDLSDEVLHFVLHNAVNHEWEVLEEARAMHDGIITVTVDSLGPFAIVVDGAADLDVDPSGPSSPQTGESTSSMFAVGAVALLCAAAFLFHKGSKRVHG